MMQHTELLKTLKTLEEQIVDPAFRKSATFLSQVLADDFMEIGSVGKIYNKAEVITLLQAAEAQLISLSNFKLKCLAENVVLVTYIATKQQAISLRSSIWKLNEGNWQLIFHQSTLCN